GPASDLYSAGVILYEALTGHRPFEVSGPAIFVHIINSMPPPLSRHRPDIDPELEALCLKALAKKPEERYPSAGEFARQLREWLGRQGLEQPASSPPFSQRASEPVLHLPEPELAPGLVSTQSPESTTESPSPTTPAPASGRKLWVVLLVLLVLLSAGGIAA